MMIACRTTDRCLRRWLIVILFAHLALSVGYDVFSRLAGRPTRPIAGHGQPLLICWS